MKRPASPELCPRFHFAAELIGRRWTGAVLYLLLQAPAGFAQLREAIPGINDRMLSERLRELESEGLVERAVLGGVPVRVRYSISPKGRALGKALEALAGWSEKWVTLAHAKAAARPARRKR